MVLHIRCVEYIFPKLKCKSKKTIKVAPFLFSVNCILVALVVNSDHSHKENLIVPSTGATLTERTLIVGIAICSVYFYLFHCPLIYLSKEDFKN